MVLFCEESTCFLFAWHFHKVEAAAFIQMEVSFLNQITSVNEVKALFTIVLAYFYFSVSSCSKYWTTLEIDTNQVGLKSPITSLFSGAGMHDFESRPHH